MKKPLDDFVRECSERNKGNWCKEVYSVTNSQGFVPSTDYFSKEVFSKDLNNYKIVREGMIAYNPSRINVGSVATQREKGAVIVSPLYVVFSVDEQNLYPEYLCYFLRSEIGLAEIAKKTSGSVRDSLKFSALQKINIRVRDLREQKFIVSILQKTERIIEKYRLLLTKLDDLVKSQFIEMFGSVEDNKNGYKVIKIKDACELVNGRAFKPEEWTTKGLPIVRIQNLNNENAPFNYFDGVVNAQHLIDSGDLLFSWSGTPGTSFGAFFWMRGKAALNQHIFKVKSKCEFAPAFLKNALNGRLDYIISRAHGGVGLQHITKKELDEVELLLPPIEQQNKFATFVEQTDKSKIPYEMEVAA